MSDRVQQLIADVQSHLAPQNRLPEGSWDKWPGIDILSTDILVGQFEPFDRQVEQLEPFTQQFENEDDRVYSENDRLFNDARLEGGNQYVGFPEAIDGDAVLADVPDIAGIESLDALAFYLPFHFFTNWGIYIRESGLLGLAADLRYIVRQGGSITVPPAYALDYACRILWAHELFHHKVEVACSRLQHSHPPSLWLYPRYFLDVSAGLNEEALANAFALRTARHIKAEDMDKALNRAARDWMRQLGPGYRDFLSFEGAHFASAKDAQVDAMARHGTARPATVLIPGRLLFRDIPSSGVPTYLVPDAGGVVSLIRNFPAYGPLRVWAYTNDHKPPHVHTGAGPGSPKSDRFEWPSRANMDAASQKVVQQFNAYADHYATAITKKVDSIHWK